MQMKDLNWTEGKWTREPVSVVLQNDYLHVEAAGESDWWRNTSYHFVHDNGHALLKDFPDKSAVEVGFVLNFSGNFDQCGIFVRGNKTNWIKAGVEFSDGSPQIGVVVTIENSDWSSAPCPDWFGKEITVRVSRDGNAITVRAKSDGDFHLVRVAPIDSEIQWEAGPFICSPSREGLVGEFTSWREDSADASLH